MIDRTAIGKIGLLLLLCATTVGGFLWLPPAAGFQNPSLARIMVFHVPCAMVAYLASGVATWYAVCYLHRRRTEDDMKSRVSFGLALLFWVLTTGTGMIFAKAQWGAYWNWDIKQGSILMLTLIYAAYFALRAAVTDPRKQGTLAAAYAVFAVLSAPYLTYILPNSTPDTLHPKGVLTGGLSPQYALVLWGGVLGLSLVYLWAFRVEVALETLRVRLHLRMRRQSPARVVMMTRGHYEQSAAFDAGSAAGLDRGLGLPLESGGESKTFAAGTDARGPG